MDAGRPEATVADLERLYMRRYGRFLRVAEAIVGDVEVARDVVQDAFARVIRSRFDYRGEGTVEGWVWRTVVNTARSAARAPRVVPVGEGQVAATSNGRVDEHDLRALIPALPERQRLILFLRYYADLDYRTIAEVLGIAPGTVGATLTAALGSLRRHLEEVPA